MNKTKPLLWRGGWGKGGKNNRIGGGRKELEKNKRWGKREKEKKRIFSYPNKRLGFVSGPATPARLRRISTSIRGQRIADILRISQYRGRGGTG